MIARVVRGGAQTAALSFNVGLGVAEMDQKRSTDRWRDNVGMLQ
jgi:hypothetical protein